MQHPYLEVSRLVLVSVPRYLQADPSGPRPHLQPYHDPQDEPSAVPLLPAFFDFDNAQEQLSRETLKRSSSSPSPFLRPFADRDHIFLRTEMIYQEIMTPLPTQ